MQNDYMYDILGQPEQEVNGGTKTPSKPKRRVRKQQDEEEEEDKLVGFEQINKALKQKAALILRPLNKNDVKGIKFRAPLILVAKSAQNPKKFSVQTVRFIRYDQESDGIWYSYVDPWELQTLNNIFATAAKTNKSLWPIVYKLQEKFTPLGLINFDNATALLKEKELL